MAEQYNHQYELLFGQPFSFYQGIPESLVLAGTDSRYIANTYVDSTRANGLKLTEFHIEFDINKSKETGQNSKITVYNISDLTRHFLNAKGNEAPLIILNAGYVSSGMNLIFQGEIMKVNETFIGHTRKTEILLKSGFRNMTEAFTVRSYRPNTKASDIVRDVVRDLKLPEGTIYYPALDGITIQKPQVLNGKSFEILKELAKNIGAKAFIEDGTINILPDNYVQRDGKYVFEISSANGNLIGSPSTKTDTELTQENQAANRENLQVRTTLNGAYQIGNQVALSSKFYTGVYEIETIQHTGSYEGSDWYSVLDIKPVDGWEIRR